MSRSVRFVVLFLLTGGISRPAEAQSVSVSSEPGTASAGPAPTVAFRSGGAFTGNFFQAPKGAARQNVFAGTGLVRLDYPAFGRAVEFHGGLGGDVYDGFDPSFYLFLGSRWVRGIHRLEADASFRTRSPRGDVGDAVGWADVLITSLSYGIRPVRSFQVQALADLDRQVYSSSAERNNHAVRVGGALRFFGLGYVLSPEIGAAAGIRDVDADEEDYDERTFWLTLRSVPTPPLYLSLRYRNRTRSYSLDQEGSSNFGREDDRGDLTLTAEISLGSRWRWTVYLSIQNAESTKQTRNFDTQYLWSGLTYTLGQV